MRCFKKGVQWITEKKNENKTKHGILLHNYELWKKNSTTTTTKAVAAAQAIIYVWNWIKWHVEKNIKGSVDNLLFSDCLLIHKYIYTYIRYAVFCVYLLASGSMIHTHTHTGWDFSILLRCVYACSGNAFALNVKNLNLNYTACKPHVHTAKMRSTHNSRLVFI